MKKQTFTFKKLINQLLIKNITFCTIESFTGGMFSEQITKISGSSKIFLGSYVVYSKEFKELLLEKKLNNIYSKQVTMELAKKALEILNSDISISFNGIAGPLVPSGTKLKVGTIFICIYSKHKSVTKKFEFEGTRNKIRKDSISKSLLMLNEFLKNF